MSLKARFRIAIASLTIGIVVVVSLLYLHGFFETSFERTAKIAESIAGNVQNGTIERLDLRTRASVNPPTDLEAARQFWLDTVDTDPAVADLLKGATANWDQISAVYIADTNERIRASSMPSLVGKRVPRAFTFENWKTRSLFSKVQQVLFSRVDTEYVRKLGAEGQPILSIHVVISSLFLRNDLLDSLKGLRPVFLLCLLIATALSIVLPTLVLAPLERLGNRIDAMMAAGDAPLPNPPQHESKEFADVHSKLNLLGQQVAGAKQDVTELRSNVAQLLEQLQEAVLFFDASGRLMMAGEPLRRFFGTDPSSLLGRTAAEIFPPETGVGVLLRQCLERREPVRDRVVTLTGFGPERQLIASIEPLWRPAPSGRSSEAAQPLGILVTMRDAATRGQLEQQLDVADRLTAMSHLTRGVAHEIKNPLNAITLHVEILKNRLGVDEVPEVEVIGREISRLNRIVKTFLDFHRPVDIRLRRLDLNALVSDLVRLVEPDARLHGVAVRTSLASEPAAVDADRDLLQQAVLNIVMNAFEAMPEGGEILISTSRGAGSCRLEIADQGPGISPEILDKIFNLFFTTKDHGSGIGLAISYRFVQLLNGTMSVASEPGRGTAFVIELPEAISTPFQMDGELSRTQRA